VVTAGAAVKAVSSRDNPLLVRLRKLAADPGGYRKAGQLWIEGDHLGAALLQRGGRPTQALITETAWARQPGLRDLAGQATEVVVIPDALMQGVSTLESPAPLGFVLPWQGEGQVQPTAPTVVLDRLQDAGNVGTVLRTAAAFGFTQCIALKGTAALWSPKVLRAGMGAHFGLNLVELADEAVLEGLRVPLLATSSHARQALHEVALPWPCGWVMGHEGQGVSAGIEARCAMSLRIPQPGGEESLNVAAAAAVCLYESARQRA
jgi:RNA methyltransferase, TrmH family